MKQRDVSRELKDHLCSMSIALRRQHEPFVPSFESELRKWNLFQLPVTSSFLLQVIVIQQKPFNSTPMRTSFPKNSHSLSLKLCASSKVRSLIPFFLRKAFVKPVSKLLPTKLLLSHPIIFSETKLWNCT